MKVWQHVYKMKVQDFPFDFIPKKLFFIKHHYSKYELDLTAALGMSWTSYDNVMKPLACYVIWSLHLYYYETGKLDM
jgi:hypothetical protein